MAEVLDAIRRRSAIGKGWLVVSGASGSGKSSLVRAGILPKLIAPGVLEGYTAWRSALLLPGTGGDPFLALSQALMEKSGLPELDSTPASLADRLGSGAAAGVEVITGALRQVAAESRLKEHHILESKARDAELQNRMTEAARFREVLTALPAPRAGLALVVDQLEEVFTQVNDTEKQAGFLNLLASLAESGRVIVLATLRTDFWTKLIEAPDLAALSQGDGRYDLMPPRPSELEEIITRPASAAGLVFESDEKGGRPLDREILDEAVGKPDALPLLQFSLEALYQARTPDGLLTRQAWRDLGGMEGAIRHHADLAFRQLRKAAREAAPDAFRRLVAARLASGGGLVFNRRWVPLVDFADEAEREFVEAMIAERLLVASVLPDGEAACALVHEALITTWPELQRHLQNDEALHLLHSWMTPYYEHWRRSPSESRSESLLPRGQHLKSLGTAMASPGGASLFSQEEKKFIDASLRQPPPTTVIIRQGAEMTFKGAIPIVILVGLIWYQNPTLLRDYVGKYLDPNYQTEEEKDQQKNLKELNIRLSDAGEQLLLHQRALNETALGLKGLKSETNGLRSLDPLKPPVPWAIGLPEPNPASTAKLFTTLPGENTLSPPSSSSGSAESQGSPSASSDWLKNLNSTSMWRRFGGDPSKGLSQGTTDTLFPYLSKEVREALSKQTPVHLQKLPSPAGSDPTSEKSAPKPLVP